MSPSFSCWLPQQMFVPASESGSSAPNVTPVTSARSARATVEEFIVEAVAKEVQGELASCASGPERRKVRFDGMRDRVELLPGWDDPIDLDRFLVGDL